MNSKNISVMAIITAVVALIVSTVLNILYRQQYYQMGVNFIYNYQANYQTSAVTIIQNIISILGNTIFIVAFLMLVHLLVYRKLNTIVYIIYIVINAYLIAVSKQAYQDSRPFFYNKQIEALEWTCPRSYGFPSGHSWVSILLYEPVISDLIGTKGWKKLLLIIIVLTGVLIPISRQYLGSHTADQVTSGVLHSMSFLILYKCLFQAQIYELALKAMKGLNSKLILLITSVCFCISIAIPFIIYSVNVNNRAFDPNYIILMNSRCEKNYEQKDLQKQAGTAASIIGLVFGLIYGFVIIGTKDIQERMRVQRFNMQINPYFSYMKGYWNFKEKCVNGFKFVLLYILFGGVFAGVIGYAIPTAYPNFYFTYSMQTVGFCLFGMSITFIIPYLLNKLEVIQIDERCKLHNIDAKTDQILSPNKQNKLN